MTDYKNLVKFLRGLSPWAFPEASNKRMQEAADAIEELQDKVFELEEELNDADIAADDNGRQVEALQAEVDALKHDIERYVQMNTELLNDRPELEEIGGKWVWKEPKRGEWKPFDLTYGRSIYSCSVCEQATEVPMCMEKPMYAYCPNCGAKMEVQE